MQELLRMENICKRFPGVVALSGIQFSVYRGEVHALVGENGAGKSTLMKILSGVYKPDEGHIFLERKEINVRDPKHAQDLGISIVFQELNLCPHLSIADNVFIGRQYHRWGLVDDKRIVEDTQKLLKEIDMPLNPKTRVIDLSVAEQQMVEIVKALSLESRLIIFDEPTSSLTQSEVDKLFEIILKLKARGIGIIYISHKLDEILQISDRITVIRDGTQIGETLINHDLSMDTIVQRMIGRSMKEKYPSTKRNIGEVIFEARDIRKKGVLDVDKIVVRSGEIVGIAGLVGAGRTELARAIFGADSVDSKTLILGGRHLRIHSPNDAIANGIAYATENRKEDGLALGMDVEANINIASIAKYARHGFVSKQRTIENAQKYVSKLKIKTPSLRQKVLYLSGGNQQKIVLAKWLCNDVKLIIFDEPTRGIDVGAKYEIYNLMNQLSAEGVGILMISSEMQEILGMSDRIFIMHNGKIVAELNREEATQERILEYAAGLRGKEEDA